MNVNANHCYSSLAHTFLSGLAPSAASTHYCRLGTIFGITFFAVFTANFPAGVLAIADSETR